MSRKILIGQMLATTAMLMEAGGPVKVKQRHSEEAARDYDEWRARNRARIERERAEAEAIRALTPEHVQARIERDEKRRADKKAAKRAAKKVPSATHR
jgi:hypothetical protein